MYVSSAGMQGLFAGSWCNGGVGANGPPMNDEALKQRVAKAALADSTEVRHFWQTRFYDFNVFSETKRMEKLKYIHRNPVRRGLVESAQD